MNRRRVITVAAGVFAAASLSACGVLPSTSAAAAVPAKPTASWLLTGADQQQAVVAVDGPSTSPSAVETSPSAASVADPAPSSDAVTADGGPVDGTSPTTAPTAPAASTPVACAGRTMNVVAHEDDDLLFINPSINNDIAAGRCVETVFVTAGDAGRPHSYWYGREEGSRAAYAVAAGLPDDWTQDTVVSAGHTISRWTLSNSKIQLLFLQLPDAHGNQYGRPVEGLQQLWRDQIPSLQTVDLRDSYTKSSLVGTLTALMDAGQPDEIRTLDFAGHYGDGDHADHHTVGYMTYAAQRDYATPHHIIGYMGYPVSSQPANLTDPVRDTKLGTFLAYAAHDNKVCQTEEVCETNFYAPRFDHSITTADEAGGS